MGLIENISRKKAHDLRNKMSAAAYMQHHNANMYMIHALQVIHSTRNNDTCWPMSMALAAFWSSDSSCAKGCSKSVHLPRIYSLAFKIQSIVQIDS